MLTICGSMRCSTTYINSTAPRIVEMNGENPTPVINPNIQRKRASKRLAQAHMHHVTRDLVVVGTCATRTTETSAEPTPLARKLTTQSRTPHLRGVTRLRREIGIPMCQMALPHLRECLVLSLQDVKSMPGEKVREDHRCPLVTRGQRQQGRSQRGARKPGNCRRFFRS